MDTIDADAAKLAGLQIDLLQKIRTGQCSLGHLEWFVKLSKTQRDMLSGADLKKLQATAGSQTKPAPSILEFVSTVGVAATTTRFVAKDKFVVNTKRNAPVKISYLGDNFKAWFLNGAGKIEDPISEQTLRYHKLRQSSVDGPIIAELGGAEKSETTLSEMFSLMEKQGKGEDGVLLNNDYANIFYIKDSAGVLRTVSVIWNNVGWVVSANSVECSCSWGDGHQVFSRNFVLESSELLTPA